MNVVKAARPASLRQSELDGRLRADDRTVPHARIVAIGDAAPTMFITRLMLWASTCNAILVATSADALPECGGRAVHHLR